VTIVPFTDSDHECQFCHLFFRTAGDAITHEGEVHGVCDLGRYEHDRSRYCFIHGGFVHGGAPVGEQCDKRPTS
jgi:hypothetical protein